MISRRTLLISGIGTAATLVARPALAQREPFDLVIVDPALVSAAPPSGTIAASGPALLQAALALIGSRGRLDAFVGPADAVLLAEVVRFRIRLCWKAVPLQFGSQTIVGRLTRPAQRVIATWG